MGGFKLRLVLVEDDNEHIGYNYRVWGAGGDTLHESRV